MSRTVSAQVRGPISAASPEEALDDIQQYLEANNMVFIAAGMGGGTGTGAAPVIARQAREQGILTVGVVTKPFQFEGVQRMRLAEAGLQELQQYVDTLIVIPNQNLFLIANEQTSFATAFNLADEVLHAGVRGVTDLMVSPGLINLDFADIRTVMGEMGKAMMGTGEAEGENRAIEAAEAAINNPLLDNASIEGARGVLINITGGSDVTLMEVDEAASRICQEVDKDANIIFGTSMSDELEGHMRVAVIATGIEADLMREPVPEPSDKVHVLGVSNRRSAERPSSGAVGEAEAEAPVMAAPERVEADSELPDETADATDDSEAVAVSGIEQNFETVEAAAPPVEPVAESAETAEPVLVEDSPPVRKTVSASTAGGFHAGIIKQKSKPEAVASEAPAPAPTASAPPAPTASNSFVAKPAVTPGQAPAAELGKKADAFRVASLENAGGNTKKRGLSLFERMTGSGKARKESGNNAPAKAELAPAPAAAPQPAARPMPEKRASAPVGAPAAKEPTFENIPHSAQQTQDVLSSEEDPYEIPAFLRRQTN